MFREGEALRLQLFDMVLGRGRVVVGSVSCKLLNDPRGETKPCCTGPVECSIIVWQ